LRNQGNLLKQCHGEDQGLLAMAAQVTSGDATGREAQGARRYWAALLGKGFRRDREAHDANRLLNYGYALLRSLCARAVAGAGLHPSLGLQHHNRYDSLALASDLMEPFRPWIDRRVHDWVASGNGTDLDQSSKANLFGVFEDRVLMEGQSLELPHAAHLAAARLGQALGEGRPRLTLPSWL
jgi:CRISPR-associated protein Cas1